MWSTKEALRVADVQAEQEDTTGVGLMCVLLVDASACSAAAGSNKKRMKVENVRSISELVAHVFRTLELEDAVRVATRS